MSEQIGVGMLGYGFMGKAHAHAFHTICHMTWPPPLRPRLVAIAGRREAAVGEAARQYGFERHVTDWRELIEDDAIGLLDNGGPNVLHAEPTIAAAEAGRHVLCEKPLGLDAAQSLEMWQRAEAAGVVHMCAFNYRFLPAIRLAREMLEAGELGDVHHFRARYLQSWGPAAARTEWRFDPAAAGSGALGDLGSHVVDLARYLVGEPVAVHARLGTFAHGTVDDAVAAVVEFEGGAMGTIEASRYATGRVNQLAWEINGSRGALAFDVERLNELEVMEVGGRSPGFRRVLVSEPGHPFWEHWWPPGHVLGWGDSFVHELHHMLAAIAGEGTVAPHGATFADGYRAAEVCDAIARSSASGSREAVAYQA
jgi:predicted dehydrogenase